MELQVQGVCRGIHHVSVHNPTAGKVFCNTCEGWVLRIKGKDCPCCGVRTRRPKTYGLCKTILSRILSSDYIGLARCFTREPFPSKVTIYCKHKQITYAVPPSCAALYYDTIETKALPAWVEHAWRGRDLAELRKSDVLKFCDKQITGIGIG